MKCTPPVDRRGFLEGGNKVTQIRFVENKDYEQVNAIMNQVQELQLNAKNSAAYEMYKKYGFTEKSINMELL